MSALPYSSHWTNQRLALARITAQRWDVPLEQFIQNREAGLYFCRECRNWMPATREFFCPGNKGWQGLDACCKQCAAKSIRDQRRKKSGAPLDAPPRSGRRPTSSSYDARYQRKRIEQMTPEQQATYYEEQRRRARERYQSEGWERVRRRREEAKRRREQERRAEQTRQLLEVARRVLAVQQIYIDQRTIAQSALLLRAQNAGLVPDCGYYPNGNFTAAFRQALKADAR